MSDYFNYHKEIRKNKIRTFFIFIIFFTYIILLGTLTGFIYKTWSNNDKINILFFVFIFLIIAINYIIIFYQNGINMILKISGAKEANRKNYPYLFHTVEALSLAAGFKNPPKCYIIEDDALNAFATGFREDKSYIVVTTGLIRKLNREEIEGVLAHEISHIKNKDMKVMLLAAGIAGAIVLLADIIWYYIRFNFITNSTDNDKKNNQLGILLFLILIILLTLTPIIVQLIKLTISRNREYLADATGAKLTRYPEGLASALEKIKNDTTPLKRYNKALSHLYISEPEKESLFAKLFSTHPPIDERIKRLRGLKI